MSQLINFAHRGSSAICPENTMAAFAKGLEQGATGIETDVQMTKDGKLVLIHDESVARTTGAEGLVKDYTYEELAKLDAGSWFGAAFQGERIPLLEELLELTKSHGTIVNIELKNGSIQYPELEKRVIETVRHYKMSEQIVISSFNHYSLVECKHIDPEIRTGLLYGEGLYKPWEYAKLAKADALHAYHRAVLPEWVTEAKQHGVVYHPWTVNDEEQMKALIDAGVAGIITDYPNVLGGLLQTKGA
ncbi:glycerophosphodiester phosphodiesterase [Virgibacillus sp. LDC1]|uniref:glycerophosphodiester phosphodiesterase n=1 Tax=Paenibacillus TaxID=44249 RepID=UPI000C279EC4|nr:MULTISPECIES: glycerophosphodiester phosphodiesterase [Paenibacillus]MCV4232244.1 glycerophosphodiester phosphodiesterase [Virgibacillus sp. LDC1]MEC0257466.1 glycerophosphodiester phosphodiesterase [Paenibacillus lautus]PJN56228.1 Glycerophosphoryl diester phosphodiesterase [Paenibacillus sp. GM2FR]